MNNEELKLKSLELQKSVISLMNGMLNFTKKYPNMPEEIVNAGPKAK